MIVSSTRHHDLHYVGLFGRKVCAKNKIGEAPALPPLFHSVPFHFILSASISSHDSHLCDMASVTVMNQVITFQNATQIRSQIQVKVGELQQAGLTHKDQQTLNNRLNFIWSDGLKECRPTTAWRHKEARRIYREIQDADAHLFLAVVLVITPTECVKPFVKDTLTSLTELDDYELYHFNLDLSAKRFFDSVAAEQGFTSNHRFSSFIQSLFPRALEPRHIQYAYSLVRSEDLPSFLETMLRGVYASKQHKDDMDHGSKTSAAMIFVPTQEDQDGSCTLRVERNVLLEAIHTYRLTDRFADFKP